MGFIHKLLRRNDEIARQLGEFHRLTMGIPSAEITGHNTYPGATSGTAVSSTPFALSLSKGLLAEGWFDRLTTNGKRPTPNSDKISTNGIGSTKSYKDKLRFGRELRWQTKR
jgi:hypothetical protein